MIYLYSLGQYFAGLVTGAIFSWVATWIYYEDKIRQEDDSDDSDQDSGESVNTVIFSNVPGKSLCVFHVPDAIMEDVKKISETLSFHTPRTSKISEEVTKILDDLKKLEEQKLASGDQVSQDLQTVIELATNALMLTKNIEYLLEDDLESPVEEKSVDTHMLSLGEEMEIITKYRGLVGQRYHSAMYSLKQDGYNLHPLYVSIGAKMPLPAYSKTTIGVRIKDPAFDGLPSSEATITEIIDVGGIDARDVGSIKL